jgi:hypothetical protein
MVERRGRRLVRHHLLEDALFLAAQGEPDLAIMRRQGYTDRELWLLNLRRAGLPKIGNKEGRTEPVQLKERLARELYRQLNT